MPTITELVHNFESGRVVRERRQCTAVRYLLCSPSAGDSESGYAYATNPPRSDGLIPRIGDQFPYDPTLCVSRVSVDGYGTFLASTGKPDYESALITVEYVSFFAELDGTPILRIESRPQAVTIPGAVWASDGAIIPDGMMQLTIPMDSICCMKASTIRPSGAIQACTGKINSDCWGPFGLGYSFMPGQVKFDGCQSEQRYDSVYGIVWQHKFMFTVNPFGWNNSLRAGTDADGNPVSDWEQWLPGYQTVAFSASGLGV
jgi:hypothetical protein